MDRFLVILVNGYLSQAELRIILSKAMIEFKIIENNETFVILEVEKASELLELGGIYKVGEIICVNNSLEKIFDEIEQDGTLTNLEDKQQWNVSYYSDEMMDIDVFDEIQNNFAGLIKENSKKTKFIRNNMKSDNFIELSVDKEKEGAVNILVGNSNKKYYIAENKISIKSIDFIDRDLNRPYQDSRISLSPRTARILVNILAII